MIQQPDQTFRQRLPTSNVRYHPVENEDNEDNITPVGPPIQPPSSSSANDGGKGSGNQAKRTNLKMQPLNKARKATKKACKPIEKAFRPVKRVWKRVSRAYDRAVADHWTYELLAIFVCISTLIAILAVLHVFRDKPSPHIMAGVPLNTVISILATLSRASTVLVAAAVIAQQKWLRYKAKSHSLLDVLSYDDATRGPLGSLTLLMTWRLSFFTALAAMVAVLALGFEPFVQQSVRYPLKDYPDSNVSSPLIQAVQDLKTENFYSNLNLTISFAAVITQALYADSVDLLQPNCPSASCAWPVHKSVAFCSLCENVTNALTIDPRDDLVLQTHTEEYYLDNLQSSNLDLGYSAGVRMAMPRNTTYELTLNRNMSDPFYAIFELLANYTLSVGGSSAAGSYTTVLSYPNTIVFDLLGEQYPYGSGITINGVQNPLKAFGYVKLGSSAGSKQLFASSAKRCIISLCAKEFSSKFRNGSLVSNVTAMSWGSFDWYNSGRWAANLTGSSFSSDLDLTYVTSSLKLFEGQVINSTRSFNPLDTPDIQNPAADVVQFMSNIEKGCANIAQGLTNFIQLYGDSVIPGQSYMSTSVVEVRWAWLAFPISLVAIVLLTLLATIIQTHHYNLPMWKSSPFPLFYNYYDPSTYSVATSDGEDESKGEESEKLEGENCFTPQAVKTSTHQEMAKTMTLRLRSVAGSWILEKEPQRAEGEEGKSEPS